ncbi:MAG: ribonuclease HII [Actinomycetia bacterium]|nr:ribonuclease HII [Actinomycetes bacterium]
MRRGSGLYGYERALARAGLAPVAGADEAGRGACAGPLVAAAVILADTPRRRIAGLSDSKLLSSQARERLYPEILEKARSVAWVEISPGDCDRLGIQTANIEALRRAVLRLDPQPGFVITDGFPVDGMGAAGLAMWKADRVAACVAAASVVAKVRRDRILERYEDLYPGYDFARHKGYCTPLHQRRLEQLGPCAAHRLRYDNVRRASRVRQP